jgi:hypothetical protein
VDLRQQADAARVRPVRDFPHSTLRRELGIREREKV